MTRAVECPVRRRGDLGSRDTLPDLVPVVVPAQRPPSWDWYELSPEAQERLRDYTRELPLVPRRRVRPAAWARGWWARHGGAVREFAAAVAVFTVTLAIGGVLVMSLVLDVTDTPTTSPVTSTGN